MFILTVADVRGREIDSDFVYRSTGSVGSLRLGGQQVARRPVSAKVKEFDATNALLS